MVGHQLGLVAVEGNLVQGAAVGLGEVRHFEVALQDFGLAQEARLDNLVGLEFLVGADDVVTGVQGVDLVGQLLGFLLRGLFFLRDSLVDRVERVHTLVQVLDLDVGSGELLGQVVDGLLLVLELGLEVSNRLLHRRVVVGGLLESFLQVIQALLVLVDGLLDEDDVIAQLLLAVGSFPVQVVDRDDVLEFFDLLHPVGDVTHELHEAILLGISRVDGILQRHVDGVLAHGLGLQFVGALAGGQQGQPGHQPN